MAAAGEHYVKLVVGFARDPKVRAMVEAHGVDGLLARDLFVQMILYCREQETDGLVPAYELPVLMHPLPPEHVQALAKHVLDAELSTCLDGAPAGAVYHVLAYVKYNGTKAAHDAAHEAKVSAGRQGGQARKSAAQTVRGARAKQVLEAEPKQLASTLVNHRREEESRTTSAVGVTRTGPQRVREGNADEDELLQVVIDAIEVTTGWPITPGQALRVRDRLTAGRTIANPNRSLVNAITTMSRDELRAMVGPAPRTDAWSDLGGQAGPGRPAAPPVAHNGQADRHPSARTVRQALARPDGEQRAASDEQRQRHADEARKALANRPGQLQPVPEPGDDGLF
jgi:hypothetical protein